MAIETTTPVGVYKKLLAIQLELKAPKNVFNKFGGFYYRKADDILAEAKKLCRDHGAVITLSDEVVQIGDRYYVKATASLIDTDTGDKITATAKARETETKKGMDAAMITGACSSYSRKYALCGLLAIDDEKDIDAIEPEQGSQDKKPKFSDKRPGTLTATENKIYAKALIEIDRLAMVKELDEKWTKFVDTISGRSYDTVLKAVDEMKKLPDRSA